MVRLTGVFSQIRRHKVLVIGDLMLDTYTIGKARRISPEAPVAIIQVQREEHRPGGAGNVMLNLISLSSDVVAVGRIGEDTSGKFLRQALADEGIDVSGIFVQDSFPTPVKNRILADNQQIVRVDHETVSPLPESIETRVIDTLPHLLEDVKVVAISDYGKGFLSRKLLANLIQLAKDRQIPVIADPKGVDFSKYSGSTVIKPNLGEAYAAANLLMDAPLHEAANRILQMVDAQTLMVTRSEAGVSLFHRNGKRDDFPVKIREVKDVTGAGDTVLAMMACAVANDLGLSAAAQLSNVAAGIAIERFGCARVTLSELARRLLDEDVTNKVFDLEHLFALKEALRGRQFSLLSLSSEEGFTPLVFSAIRRLAKENERDLLVHVHDSEPNAEFVSLLASLHEVDFIILDNENLKDLCRTIVPHEVHIIEKQLCKRLDAVHDMFQV